MNIVPMTGSFAGTETWVDELVRSPSVQEQKYIYAEFRKKMRIPEARDTLFLQWLEGVQTCNRGDAEIRTREKSNEKSWSLEIRDRGYEMLSICVPLQRRDREMRDVDGTIIVWACEGMKGTGRIDVPEWVKGNLNGLGSLWWRTVENGLKNYNQ